MFINVAAGTRHVSSLQKHNRVIVCKHWNYASTETMSACWNTSLPSSMPIALLHKPRCEQLPHLEEVEARFKRVRSVHKQQSYALPNITAHKSFIITCMCRSDHSRFGVHQTRSMLTTDNMHTQSHALLLAGTWRVVMWPILFLPRVLLVFCVFASPNKCKIVVATPAT